MTAATKRKQPTLAEIQVLSVGVERAELELARCRARLTNAIRQATALSHTEVARAIGLSRQRVAQIREVNGA